MEFFFHSFPTKRLLPSPAEGARAAETEEADTVGQQRSSGGSERGGENTGRIGRRERNKSTSQPGTLITSGHDSRTLTRSTDKAQQSRRERERDMQREAEKERKGKAEALQVKTTGPKNKSVRISGH